MDYRLFAFKKVSIRYSTVWTSYSIYKAVMSSEDNSILSKVTYKPSEVVSSLAIDNEEGIGVQSIVSSTDTISVFDSVSESALDDARVISMASLHSSIQGSLLRYSLQSSRQSLNHTVQSLNDSQLMPNEKDGVDSKVNDNTKSRKDMEDKIKIEELARKEKMLRKVQYAMYTLLSIIAAFIVMIIWYTSWLEKQSITIEIGNEQTDIKASLNNSSCPFWAITGDGFCDDEANIPECGYDFKDCCQMENDRTICEDCFCFVPEDSKRSIKEEHLELCQLYHQHHLGDGSCDLNQNTEDNFFDFGDCCLEDISCRVKFFNSSNYVEKYCPTNPCIRSNIFCVEEELGNGICEDYNNGPYCDYDLGDCCLMSPNDGQTTTEKHTSKDDCCMCSCKQTSAIYWGNHMGPLTSLNFG